jgi:uncharacterized membrane protein YhaH (DUF805 family)
MNWFLLVFKRWAEFSGRSRRTEYWMFTLTAYVTICLLSASAMIANSNSHHSSPVGVAMIWLNLLYWVALLMPGAAVTVRRLHDTGRSGWCTLIVLVPLIGASSLLVFLCQESAADNQYGPTPKLDAPGAQSPRSRTTSYSSISS